MQNKYFLSHKFTGLKYNDINKDLLHIRDVLLPEESEYFCTLWMQEYFIKHNMSDDDIYKFSLKKQEKSNIFLAYIISEEISKGMILELNKAIKLNQEIILIIKQDLINNKDFIKFVDNANKIYKFNKNITEIKKL